MFAPPDKHVYAYLAAFCDGFVFPPGKLVALSECSGSCWWERYLQPSEGPVARRTSERGPAVCGFVALQMLFANVLAAALADELLFDGDGAFSHG